MVIDNETGFLVPAGDADGLADAIDRVIIDLALAKKLGQAGHERAETLFSIQKNVHSLLALFDANLG